MDFFNTWWIYALVVVIFLYVIAQSVTALIKAVRQARRLGFSKVQIREVISSSAIFSIAPSIAILISLTILSKVFGPWVAGLRLGTLGAYTYELPAALNVIDIYSHLNIDLCVMKIFPIFLPNNNSYKVVNAHGSFM